MEINILSRTKLNRIVAPKSGDHAICWLSEAEFLKLCPGAAAKDKLGYDDLSVSNGLVGVPVLTNNWFVK